MEKRPFAARSFEPKQFGSAVRRNLSKLRIVKKNIGSVFLLSGIAFLLVATLSVPLAAAQSYFNDMTDQAEQIGQSDPTENVGDDTRHLILHLDFQRLQPHVTFSLPNSPHYPDYADTSFCYATAFSKQSSGRAPPV